MYMYEYIINKFKRDSKRFTEKEYVNDKKINALHIMQYQ